MDRHLTWCALAFGHLTYFYAIFFLILHDIPVANSADDNTPYCTGLKISDCLIKLENATETLLQWFKDNRMKVNPDKYHLLVNNTKENFQIKIGNKAVSNSKNEKLLGVKLDHELNVILLAKRLRRSSGTPAVTQGNLALTSLPYSLE